MNNIIYRISSVILFFSLVIHSGESKKCFSCTAKRSSSDPCVKDVSFDIAVVNCPGTGKQSCKVEITDDTITRECGLNGDCKNGSKCVHCYVEDYCNTDYTYKGPDPNKLYVRQGPTLKPPQ